eukprot:5534-Heterococcus_DN1.PRE.5
MATTLLLLTSQYYHHLQSVVHRVQLDALGKCAGTFVTLLFTAKEQLVLLIAVESVETQCVNEMFIASWLSVLEGLSAIDPKRHVAKNPSSDSSQNRFKKSFYGR